MLIYIEDYLQRRASATMSRMQRPAAGSSASCPANVVGLARRSATALALVAAPSEPALPSAWELDVVYAEASLI